MNDRLTKFLPLLMFAGLGLGALCGFVLPEFSLAIDFVGRLFMGVLRFIVVPLLVAGAVTGLASLTESRMTAKISLVFVSYVLATTVIAVVVAVGLSLLLIPDHRFTGVVANPLVSTWGSVSEALGDLIPANPLRAITEGKYLGLVLLGALLGTGLVALGARGRTVLTLFRGLHEALLKVVQIVLYVAPVGLFSLVAAAVAQPGGSLTGWMATSGGYLGVSLAALIVHGVVILPLISWYAGRSPWRLYSDLSAALLTGFGTGSKAVSFPVTAQCLNDRARLDSRAITAVLPPATVLNLSGAAIVMITGTMFVAHALGSELGLISILGLSVLAVILSFGAAGLPSSMLLAAPVLFGAVGLTGEQMALAIPVIAAFDWLVDRMAAVVNVGSDAIVVSIAGETLTNSSPRRSSRSRRVSRDEGAFDRRGRRPRPARVEEGRPATSGLDRGQSGSRDRGRTGGRHDGRSSATGERSRGRSDSAEPSPFQIRAGRTSAFGSGTDRPISGAERSEHPRERADRRERRPSHEGPGERRRSSGRTRGRSERGDVDRRTSHQSLEPPESLEVVEDSEERRVSREAVARDLARSSAQLGKGAHGDSASLDGSSTESDEHDDTTSRAFEITSSESQFPRSEESLVDDAIASVSERADWDDVIESSDAADSEETLSETDQDSPEPETPTAFGRRRAYAGAAFKRSNSHTSDETSEPADTTRPQGYSSEDVSFGRAKRKKTRR